MRVYECILFHCSIEYWIRNLSASSLLYAAQLTGWRLCCLWRNLFKVNDKLKEMFVASSSSSHWMFGIHTDIHRVASVHGAQTLMVNGFALACSNNGEPQKVRSWIFDFIRRTRYLIRCKRNSKQKYLPLSHLAPDIIIHLRHRLILYGSHLGLYRQKQWIGPFDSIEWIFTKEYTLYPMFCVSVRCMCVYTVRD